MSAELTFSHMVLPKEVVAVLSSSEKRRFLMITNMLRDMDLFRKLLVYAVCQKTGHEELDEAAFVTMAFSVTKILISKVYEAWEFFEKEGIAQEKENFSGSLRGQWAEVESFFSVDGNKRLFCFVRNKFGFHFDHYKDLEPYIENAMKEVGDLEFWMAGQAGSVVYSSSNVVMLIVLCHKMRELGFTGTNGELIGQLQKLPIEISFAVNEFCIGYFTEVLLKDKAFHERKTVTVTVPLLSETHLPLIVYNDLHKSA